MCFYSILLGLVFRWPFLEDAVQEIQLDWMVSKKKYKKIKFRKPQVLTSTIATETFWLNYFNCKLRRHNFAYF